MNLLFLNHYARPPSMAGGTRHYDFGRELVRRGHRVTVVASSFDHEQRRELLLRPGERYRAEDHHGVRFVWLRTTGYRGNGLLRFWGMVSYAANAVGTMARIPHCRLQVAGSRFQVAGKPDVVVGSSVHLLAGLAAFVLARRFRARFVLEIRDLWPQTLVETHGLGPLHPAVLVFGALERLLLPRADAVITLLPGSVDFIVSRGVRRERITVIPNGVDCRRVQLLPATKGGVPGSRFQVAGGGGLNVLYFGSHGVANGLDVLLDAARSLKEQSAPVRLVFVGGGARKRLLMRRAEELRLGNVEFHDPVPDLELARFVRQADVLVCCQRYSPVHRFGVSPNKLARCLAWARPLLFVGRVGAKCGIPISVEEIGAGIVAAPDDPAEVAAALMRLLRMPAEERTEMGMRGRSYVEAQLDIAGLCDRLEAALKGAKQRSEGSYGLRLLTQSSEHKAVWAG